MYEVKRRLGSSGPFTFLGTVGKKRFEDNALPAGVASVEYQVTAFRSTRRGSTGHYILNFGGVPQHVIASFRPKNAA